MPEVAAAGVGVAAAAAAAGLEPVGRLVRVAGLGPPRKKKRILHYNRLYYNLTFYHFWPFCKRGLVKNLFASKLPA